MVLHADSAEAVGKNQILGQALAGKLWQLGGGHAVPLQLPQKRADKAVSRAGGVHRRHLGAAGAGTGGAGIGAGTLAAAGVQYQLHIPGKQPGQRGFNILRAGEEGQLLVRKLQDMGQGKKLPHGLAQLLPVRPEREAEIGVKAEDGSRLPRGSDGSQMGVAHGAVHQ